MLVAAATEVASASQWLISITAVERGAWSVEQTVLGRRSHRQALAHTQRWNQPGIPSLWALPLQPAGGSARSRNASLTNSCGVSHPPASTQRTIICRSL